MLSASSKKSETTKIATTESIEQPQGVNKLQNSTEDCRDDVDVFEARSMSQESNQESRQDAVESVVSTVSENLNAKKDTPVCTDTTATEMKHRNPPRLGDYGDNDNTKCLSNHLETPSRAPSRTPSRDSVPTHRRLDNKDVRAIFECLHGHCPPPPHLPFVIVCPGPNGQRLSPPSFAFDLGLYVFLRPNKTPKATKEKKNYVKPKPPTHLHHLLWQPNTPEDVAWGLSGPQFPKPTAIQQRYCYPKTGRDGYKSRTGGSLWTMYNINGEEDEEFRLLHVYYSAKRAVNRGVETPPDLTVEGDSPRKRTKPTHVSTQALHSPIVASPESSLWSNGSQAQVVSLASSASTNTTPSTPAASGTCNGSHFCSPGDHHYFPQHSYNHYQQHDYSWYSEYNGTSWAHGQPRSYPPPAPPSYYHQTPFYSTRSASPRNVREDTFGGRPFHPIQQRNSMDPTSPYHPQSHDAVAVAHQSFSPILSPPMPTRTTPSGTAWPGVLPMPQALDDDAEQDSQSMSMSVTGPSLNVGNYWCKPNMDKKAAGRNETSVEFAEKKSYPNQLHQEQLEALQQRITDLIAGAPAGEQECLLALMSHWAQNLEDNPPQDGSAQPMDSPPKNQAEV